MRPKFLAYSAIALQAYTCFAMAAQAKALERLYNQAMGKASTGEEVVLVKVETIFRGGFGSWVTYKIGSDTVRSGIQCPSSSLGIKVPYFTDQGRRYAQSSATKKILAIACEFEKQQVARN
jgi:hypothetical protein